MSFFLGKIKKNSNNDINKNDSSLKDELKNALQLIKELKKENKELKLKLKKYLKKFDKKDAKNICNDNKILSSIKVINNYESGINDDNFNCTDDGPGYSFKWEFGDEYIIDKNGNLKSKHSIKTNNDKIFNYKIPKKGELNKNVNIWYKRSLIWYPGIIVSISNTNKLCKIKYFDDISNKWYFMDLGIKTILRVIRSRN